jgi:glycosyltransferase involved in cell wall biosynthesis
MKLLVIVPAYNSQRFIDKTIESLRNQSIPITIVVVDDCSTDDTYKIISKYKDIIILRNSSNMGTYYSINRGLNHMSSDKSWTHYSIHGSDDVSFKDRYKKQLNTLNNSNDSILAVGCRFNRVDYKTNKVYKTNPNTNESLLLMKRQAFDLIGYYDNERAACDTEYKKRLLLAQPGCILSIDEILMDAYYHESNITRLIPIGGRYRVNYVDKFTKKHNEMIKTGNFYQSFES